MARIEDLKEFIAMTGPRTDPGDAVRYARKCLEKAGHAKARKDTHTAMRWLRRHRAVVQSAGIRYRMGSQ